MNLREAVRVIIPDYLHITLTYNCISSANLEITMLLIETKMVIINAMIAIVNANRAIMNAMIAIMISLFQSSGS
jgi:hypothetical protein